MSCLHNSRELPARFNPSHQCTCYILCFQQDAVRATWRDYIRATGLKIVKDEEKV
jgi:hypothetical protein